MQPKEATNQNRFELESNNTDIPTVDRLEPYCKDNEDYWLDNISGNADMVNMVEVDIPELGLGEKIVVPFKGQNIKSGLICINKILFIVSTKTLKHDYHTIKRVSLLPRDLFGYPPGQAPVDILKQGTNRNQESAEFYCHPDNIQVPQVLVPEETLTEITKRLGYTSSPDEIALQYEAYQRGEVPVSSNSEELWVDYFLHKYLIKSPKFPIEEKLRISAEAISSLESGKNPPDVVLESIIQYAQNSQAERPILLNMLHEVDSKYLTAKVTEGLINISIELENSVKEILNILISEKYRPHIEPQHIAQISKWLTGNNKIAASSEELRQLTYVLLSSLDWGAEEKKPYVITESFIAANKYLASTELFSILSNLINSAITPDVKFNKNLLEDIFTAIVVTGSGMAELVKQITNRPDLSVYLSNDLIDYIAEYANDYEPYVEEIINGILDREDPTPDNFSSMFFYYSLKTSLKGNVYPSLTKRLISDSRLHKSASPWLVDNIFTEINKKSEYSLELIQGIFQEQVLVEIINTLSLEKIIYSVNSDKNKSELFYSILTNKHLKGELITPGVFIAILNNTSSDEDHGMALYQAILTDLEFSDEQLTEGILHKMISAASLCGDDGLQLMESILKTPHLNPNQLTPEILVTIRDKSLEIKDATASYKKDISELAAIILEGID